MGRWGGEIGVPFNFLEKIKIEENKKTLIIEIYLVHPICTRDFLSRAKVAGA
jgi:hypothetical protein